MEWLYCMHSFWCRVQLSIISCCSGNDNQSITLVSASGSCTGLWLQCRLHKLLPHFFFHLIFPEETWKLPCAGSSWGLWVAWESRMRWTQAVLCFALYNPEGVLTACNSNWKASVFIQSQFSVMLLCLLVLLLSARSEFFESCFSYCLQHG